ncbi:unnamed protein product [marine sediment metagenome]|uniref:Uncharacterized protein n=1 Tax=marine sediment metagenome TaxID=412755 RepID=X1H2C3_9ZZZZ
MASGFPDWQIRAFTSAENSEQLRVVAGPGEATTSFTQQVKSVLIYNDGVNPVHINFDAAATLLNMILPSKSWFVADLQVTDIHTICAVGHSATVYILGTY